ncbi:hypothetical protein YPPY14_0966, partial [Yersinia pestis PY-14]
MRSPVRL